MSEFIISNTLRQSEINRTIERSLRRDRLFVLLLGPSAVGKSTIISEMNAQSDQPFEYVKPLITRPNRPNETDKISIADEVFDELDNAGEFVVVNNLYGVRYGTPLQGILDPLQRGATPILDYPLETVDALQRSEYDTLNFYIYPRSLGEWQSRIERSGRNQDNRLESGIRELGYLATHDLVHPSIDISIVNTEDAAGEAAKDILQVIEQVTQ